MTLDMSHYHTPEQINQVTGKEIGLIASTAISLEGYATDRGCGT
jgi:hypothetical protein